MKKLLSGIFFMMFLVNFIPRANAATLNILFDDSHFLLTDIKDDYWNGADPSFYNADVKIYYNNVLNDPSRNNIWPSIIQNLATGEWIISHLVIETSTATGNYNTLRFTFDESFIHDEYVAGYLDEYIQFLLNQDNLKIYHQTQDGNTLLNKQDMIFTYNGQLLNTSPVPTPPTIWLMGTAIFGLMVRKKIIA